MDVHHGIERFQGRHRQEDLWKIRTGIRIGDLLLFPQESDDFDGPAVRWSEAAVTGIYPHLVSVTGPGSMIRTVTYVEMWLRPRMLNGLEERLGIAPRERGRPRPWTKREEEQLMEMCGRGMSWDGIGEELGRTSEACRAKHRKMQEERA